MHSIYSRVNNLSAFLSTCTMVLLAAIALSSFVFNADPKGDLSIASVKVYGFFPGIARIFSPSDYSPDIQLKAIAIHAKKWRWDS